MGKPLLESWMTMVEQVGHLFLFSGGIDATSRNLCSALMAAVFRVSAG